MRVAVICEESGTVRDAFTAEGHDAISVDLKPSRTPGQHHQGDALAWLKANAHTLDLAILHPPCTYLCNSGARWLHDEPDDSGFLKGPPRWVAMFEAAAFFRACLEVPVPRVAVENPVIHGYARALIGARQTQTIQPYQHGHLKRKRTALWLRGLPPLHPSHDLTAETLALPYAQTADIHHASPGKDRAEVRSVTYPGIARAMARQWGADDLLTLADQALAS